MAAEMPLPRQPDDMTVGITSSSSSDSLHNGFIRKYEGNAHEVLIDTLLWYQTDYLRTRNPETPYSMSLAILQSSGMGKSRMISEAAKRVLTIQINTRERLGKGITTYPPVDLSVRDYFDRHPTKTDTRLQIEYAIFLEELFKYTVETIKSRGFGDDGSEESLALEWSEYMMHGQNTSSVGQNRREFYDDVVRRAEEVEQRCKLVPTNPNEKQWRKDINMLRETCKQFFDELKPLGLGSLCLVSFDEAHGLTHPHGASDPEMTRTPYLNLNKVLSTIVDSGFFFVFLSTNSRLRWFAPTPDAHPSARTIDVGRKVLFAPFTELPFDVFAKGHLSKLKPLSLEKVCQVDTMASMGRPLWFIHHSERSLGHKDLQPVIKLAMLKLISPTSNTASPSVQIERRDGSYLAALGVRVGITFNATSPAFDAQSRLVERYMRVAMVVPVHRAYIWTCAPSEPILAEAAGRMCDVEIEGPEILNKFFGRGVLARGERGEVVGRMLLTAAHDRAIKDSIDRRVDVPRYHVPVELLGLLRGLFSPDMYAKVLTVKPTGDKEGLELQHAFRHAYVHSSHFTLAKRAMLHPDNLYKALLRGMALQCTGNQRSIDAVIPIHLGLKTDSISPATTSSISLQFKNRKRAEDVFIDRSIAAPDYNTPALSIIMELGFLPPNGTDLVHSVDNYSAVKLRLDPKYHERNHYVLVAYGHGPSTYNVISKAAKPQYTELLSPVDMLEEFDRSKRDKNKRLLLNMKPVFSGEETDWF